MIFNRLIVNFDSIEMVGIDEEESNLSRPILIQPLNQSQLKQNQFFHLHLETNPLNTQFDYRIQAESYPLQICYHAV